jgi:DNA-binding transcriptional ArsR family regulator
LAGPAFRGAALDCFLLQDQPSSFQIHKNLIDFNIYICEHLQIQMPEISQFTAEFFKVLAHPLRVRIVDALRTGEIAVNDLSSRLKVEQSTLSQQLAVLRKANIVIGRKEGQNVYYSIQDRSIFRVLDEARQVFNNHLIDIRDLLEQLGPQA